MKTARTQLTDAIKSSYNLVALPKATIEWNMNRYFDTTVDNVPAEDTNGYDIEMFPITSIVEPLRPTKGAMKAMAGAAMVSDVYTDAVMPRFYVASTDDKYKYWISPNRSDSTGAITGCSPFVIYEKNVAVNKIVINLENTWASPTDFVVDTTTVASPTESDWNRAATNPTIANNGQIVLYWNGSSWSSTRPATLTNTRTIRGVRIKVNSLGPGKLSNGTTTTYQQWNDDGNPALGEYQSVATTGKNSYFSLIQLSARLEVDISDRLINVESTFDAGESSMLTPMGNITSNVGSINLWNGDNYFDKDNESSPYVDLLEPNAEVNVSYNYYLNGTGSAATDVVQDMKMYVSQWSTSSDGTASMSLDDYSKFLKDEPVPAMMYENVTLKEIVYRVCDAVGFNNFTITQINANQDFVIPVWYTNGEETLWEVFESLATDTQSLIYFDSYGVLQVKSRYAAFDPARAVDWTFLGTKRSTSLADIVDLNKSGQYEANYIRVMYSYTHWSEWNNGNPSMAVVWEPDGDLALRAVQIIEDISSSETTAVRISPKDAKIWPFSSMANIEGEIISFDAKEYVYFSNTGVATKVWLTSQEDFTKYKAGTPQQYRYRNYFTGRIRIKERGKWNSAQRAHSYKPKTYTIRRFVNGQSITSNRGVVHNLGDSSLTLHSAGVLSTPLHRLLVTTGSQAQVGDYKMYGTRIRFEKGAGYTHQRAGIVINNKDTAENGYYIELTPTNKLSTADLKTRNEVTLFIRNNGADKMPSEKLGCLPINKGARVGIKEDAEYLKKLNDKKADDNTAKNEGGGAVNPTAGDAKGRTRTTVAPLMEFDVDVRLDVTSGGRHRIRVWVNGTVKIDTYVAVADTIPLNTKFGVYVRGKTKATFDYLYAVRDHAKLREPMDDMSFFDRVRGGYYGTYATHEIPYETSSQVLLPKKNSTQRKNNRPDFYFDEFGAQLHEVREFDVKFSDAPCLHSRLYWTNDWSSTCLEYRATPFSAHFVMANTSRQTAVINGTETITGTGGSREVDHRTNVIGRTLTIEEAKEYVVKNDKQIRSRGKIETQVDSRWIQSEEAAKVVGAWITDFWSDGQDELTVEVFGNPLLEVGDLVAIDYPAKNMEPANNKYFITSVNTSFESGLSTSLVMRRRSYAS